MEKCSQKLEDSPIYNICFCHSCRMFYLLQNTALLLSVQHWQLENGCDTAIVFAEHYNADGGDATVVDLTKAGITGNSHFMFQETNNREIVDHIEKWLKERGL